MSQTLEGVETTATEDSPRRCPGDYGTEQEESDKVRGTHWGRAQPIPHEQIVGFFASLCEFVVVFARGAFLAAQLF